MQFGVDVEKLIDTGLNINEYLLCQFIYNEDKKLLDYYMEQFDRFFNKETVDKLRIGRYLELVDERLGYLFSNIQVTELFVSTFVEEEIKIKKATKSNNDEISWFEEWYSLWPRGIKSGGYPVKGDRKGCLKKLIKFTNEYPEFGKEIITKATKDYIDSCRLKRYDYMKLAHFFIYKDGMSSLASYCELIQEKIKNGTYDLDDNINYDNIRDI